MVQTSKDQVEISGDGGKVKVAFASALDWYVETQDAWLHVTPDKGVAGNGVITVEADKNMDIEKRTGVVNICSEDVVFPVKIIQKPYEATFEMLESEKTVSCLGGNMILKVNADVDYECTIDADWIKAADSKAASVRQHQFNVEPNTGDQRTAVVSFHYGAMTKTVTVIQRAVGTEADDWQLGEFAHRSLAMRFTADWCGYCPYMAVAFKNAKSQMGDRLELVSLHGGKSRYEFSGTATLERRFKASSYPTGIVDARDPSSCATLSIVRQEVVPTHIRRPPFALRSLIISALFCVTAKCSVCITCSSILSALTGRKVPSPTWSITGTISTPISLIFCISSGVKWSPAVGAAAEPSSRA